MKRWQKIILFTALLLAVVVSAGITATVGWRPIVGPRARALTDRRFDPTPARLARGAYLLNAVTPCLVCHSEPEANSVFLPKPGMEGAGRTWKAEGMPWLVSANITPDRDTGAGDWSDDTIARAIREGISHDGRALFPMMPYKYFRQMSDEDLASVVTYLRTIRPVRQQRQTSTVPFPVSRFINNEPEPIEAPVPEPDLSTPEKRGQYLATLGVCAECHSPINDRGQPVPGMDFGGGNTLTFEGKPSAAAANLTPSPNGIPYYTEGLFLETIRTGHVRERAVSDLMPWVFYKNMTDEDLKSIFAYLKTLTPVDHYVDNALAPTSCARCGLQHGGGARNKKVS
jgi:mono/diheme cytochrome c family protein